MCFYVSHPIHSSQLGGAAKMSIFDLAAVAVPGRSSMSSCTPCVSVTVASPGARHPVGIYMHIYGPLVWGWSPHSAGLGRRPPSPPVQNGHGHPPLAV